MKPAINRRGKQGLRSKPRMTWTSHTRISRLLRQYDCNVIGLLADFAKDKTVDPALRFRAIERLASLQFLPSVPPGLANGGKGAARENAPAADIAAAIARNWEKDE